MTKEKYTIIEDYMLSCMKDSAHDKEHIYRVLYNALRIAKTKEQVDYDVLISACLLHDIGRKEQFENPKLCHAMIGGEKAYSFLLELGYEKEYAERVKHCIQTHRFRQNNPPQSIEAEILFDADKLDAAIALERQGAAISFYNSLLEEVAVSYKTGRDELENMLAYGE